MRRVEYIFIRDRQLDLLIGQRSLATGRDPRGSSENSTDHRRESQYQPLAGTKVIADPQRPRPQVLVVVACFQVQPAAVRRENWIHIGLTVRNDVAIDGKVIGPRVFGSISRIRRRTARRSLAQRLPTQEDNHGKHSELLHRFQNAIVTDVVAHPPSAMATPTSAKPTSIAQPPAR